MVMFPSADKILTGLLFQAHVCQVGIPWGAWESKFHIICCQLLPQKEIFSPENCLKVG